MPYLALDDKSPEGATVISIVKGLYVILDAALEHAVLAGDQSVEANQFRSKVAMTAAMAFAGSVLGRALEVRHGPNETAARMTFENTLDATFTLNAQPTPPEEIPNVH
jgi:hypothetical protein